MNTCWSEGEIRARLDGESLRDDAGHFDECPACDALRQEIAGRAARVSALMSALDTPVVRPTVVLTMPRPLGQRVQRWQVAGIGAIAAGLVAVALLLPHPVAHVSTPNPEASHSSPAVVPEAPVQTASSSYARRPRAAVPIHARADSAPAPAAAPTTSDDHYFLALDDEPLDSGVVMRVASPSGDFQADVIVGPDGRAHAIRIVNSGNGDDNR